MRTGPATRLARALRRLEALTDWERADRRGMRVDGTPCADLWRHLGDPHRSFRAVHVSGSKGKGTVCALVSAALESAGFSVGTFTSPHVESLSERVRLDGLPVSDDALSAALHATADAHEAATAAGSAGARASWFDALVAAALWSMREARVDWGVVECGLGGAHDSTAALGAELAVLTSAELEHVEVLGSDLCGIAREKAGIV